MVGIATHSLRTLHGRLEDRRENGPIRGGIPVQRSNSTPQARLVEEFNNREESVYSRRLMDPQMRDGALQAAARGNAAPSEPGGRVTFDLLCGWE